MVRRAILRQVGPDERRTRQPELEQHRLRHRPTTGSTRLLAGEQSHIGEADIVVGLTTADNDAFLWLTTGISQGFRFGKTVPIKPGAQALIDYLSTIRDVAVTSPVPASVGGIDGLSVDVTVKRGDEPVDLFLFGNGGYTVIGAERIRIVALESRTRRSF